MKFQLSETIWWWIEPCGEAPFPNVFFLVIFNVNVFHSKLGVVGGAGVELHLVGPCRQLEGLRAGLGRAGAELWELDTRAAWQ